SEDNRSPSPDDRASASIATSEQRAGSAGPGAPSAADGIVRTSGATATLISATSPPLFYARMGETLSNANRRLTPEGVAAGIMTRVRFPLVAIWAGLTCGGMAYAQSAPAVPPAQPVSVAPAGPARIDDIQVSQESGKVSILVRLSQQPTAASVSAT